MEFDCICSVRIRSILEGTEKTSFQKVTECSTQIEVDPHIFLKQHKYPKDELMMNPYLRYPLYHRLPLHYRLTMEEPIPVCRDIVNGRGNIFLRITNY